MGTRSRGYKVHRHKGRYYVHYNHSNSDPDGLGSGILYEIRHDVLKEVFEEWVRKTFEYVYEDSERWGDEKNYVSDKRPEIGPMNDIELIYEIDLDNLVFHVNSQPLFRLDNMPPDVEYILFDHFGHTALYEHTPTQFRYDDHWRARAPSPLPESLVAYNCYDNRSSTSVVHDLLSVPVALSSVDRVRTALVELLVVRCMADRGVGRDVRLLENVPDRNRIPQSMLQLALSLVNFAVGPPIPSLSCTPHDSVSDFVWIREDPCLRITTHLDNEDILKASIGDLVRHIDATLDKVGTVYGIACSIFHCAIARVDKDEQGTSLAHTSALQFLPSFYARTMFTPGVEALSSLGSKTSGVEFLNAISDANNLPRFTHKEVLVTGSVAEKVSVEVWTKIGSFVTSPADLVTLASISTRSMSAAANLAHFPLVEDFRLVDVVASGPVQPIPETTCSTNTEDIKYYYYDLGGAKFTAIRKGRRINIELGQEFGKNFKLRRKISFEAQTYLSGPVVIMDNELYILELDDDDNAS